MMGKPRPRKRSAKQLAAMKRGQEALKKYNESRKAKKNNDKSPKS